MDQRSIEDRASIAAMVVAVAPLLGGLYLYTLGKKAGQLSSQDTSSESATLPAEETEDAKADPSDLPDEG